MNVRRMRAMRGEGKTYKEVAEALGVSLSTVYIKLQGDDELP